VQYPAEFTTVTSPTLVGSVSGNTICIDLPLNLFGASRPIGNTLYNVTAFSGGRDNVASDVYTEGDSTRSFDFSLGTISTASCAAPVACVRSNVALASNGSTAVGSSSHFSGSYPEASAINGDRTGNSWGTSSGGWADGTRGAYPDMLEVQFSGSEVIDEIDVITLQNNWKTAPAPNLTTSCSGEGILDFEAQYWNGSTWLTVPNGTVTNNDKAWRQFTFAAVTTTKIRVKVNNARNNYSRIVELEAYGCPP
jgi:hypothetical protein